MASVSSLEEASTALAAATAAGRRVRIGDDLTVEGLDRILEHEPGDLTCVVEAGMRLSTLGAALARHGQRFSLDPPGDPSIGACVAGSLSGPLRHLYGAPRDLVLGVTLVLADGTIASAGGKVVKNVAGYDLAKLVCGSRGRLALIARVALRLHPLPASRRTLVVETSHPVPVVRQLMRSHLRPSALDLLHPGRVAVLFEGTDAAVDAQLGVARELVGGAEAGEDVWGEARTRQGAARGRLRFPPGALDEVLCGVDEAVVRPGPGVAYVPYEVADPRTQAARTLEQRVLDRFDPTGTLA